MLRTLRKFTSNLFFLALVLSAISSKAAQSDNDTLFVITQSGDQLEGTSTISTGIRRIDNDYLVLFKEKNKGSKFIFKLYDTPLALGMLSESGDSYYVLSMNATSYVYRIFSKDDAMVFEGFSKATPPSVIWCHNEEWPQIHTSSKESGDNRGNWRYSKADGRYIKSKTSCLKSLNR
ncbi:hypothetical protein [Diaphorobacter caeni]|uniref:hypothetical protein n=1 Tax=Diaphorobacter caeni TaxID=2784387 RepID=UPI0018901D65|nr:hypothetical protein [Diaphorobacter caeni]MBF5006955.1 hypothetical protein [Diaphorobacter caeni]